jgi:hypothetical protein
VVLGLATNTKPPRLNARKDDAHELAKGSWVEGDDAVRAAAFCIFGVYAIAWNRGLCGATNGS